MGEETPETKADSGEERAAFDRMYAAHAPRVRRRLLRLTDGDREEAEDLTQESFVAAYVGRKGFRRRRWRDSRRAARPEAVPLPEMAQAKSDAAGEALNAITLESALSELDVPARRAVLLVLGHGLTYKEAAAATGEPVGTVKWRVHEATRRLRILLREEETL